MTDDTAIEAKQSPLVPMTRVSHRRGMQSEHEPITSGGSGGPNPLYTHE